MAYDLRDAPNLLHSEMQILTQEQTSTITQETPSIRHHKVQVATNVRVTILASQLLDDERRHLSCRIADEKIQTHWSFEWSRKNLPHMAAIMAILR